MLISHSYWENCEKYQTCVARCTRAPFQEMFISLKVGFLFSRFSGILQPKVDSAGTQLQQNLPQILPQNSEALPFKIAK